MGMGFQDARHLLSRAGFTGTPKEVRRFAKMSRAEAVRTMLGSGAARPVTDAPDWVDMDTPDPEERRMMGRDFRKTMKRYGQELKVWWITEMVATPNPLAERMTLFWHNHFTSSLRKVKFTPLMYRQNVLLRRHALGNFSTLLHDISKDPAMLIYLDGHKSHKRQPNENYAREVMELFTLGEGHYTERDIKEAARAFTGWKINRRTGSFRFAKRAHDKGTKTFLDRTGTFTGDDILDILLAQPQTARWITAKLWNEFIATPLSKNQHSALASTFRNARYELRPVLQEILTSDAFFAPANRGAAIKSPIEFLVGTMRLFQTKPKQSDTKKLIRLLRSLGQNPFDPPNVKGWEGGNAWITTNTLLIRQHALRQVLKNSGQRLDSPDDYDTIRAWLRNRKLSDQEAAEGIVKIFNPLPLTRPLPKTRTPRDVVMHAMLDPTYQLK